MHTTFFCYHYTFQLFSTRVLGFMVSRYLVRIGVTQHQSRSWIYVATHHVQLFERETAFLFHVENGSYGISNQISIIPEKNLDKKQLALRDTKVGAVLDTETKIIE